MGNRLLFLCSFAAVIQPAAWAQAADPRDLLLRVRGNVTGTMERLPKYMCSLTIDRSQYAPSPIRTTPSCDELVSQQNKGQSKPRLLETDRLRLDVAIGAGAANEIYSWVGEARFDDRGLFDLVREGAAQTGAYSIFLSSIFSGSVASFSYNGDTAVDGRALVEFGFQVPLEKSNYVFGNRREHVTTAYEGTVLVDPKTDDLVRMVVRTSELPGDVGSCQATTTLDYHRVHLNDSEFLLPREAQLDILNTDGSLWRNRTVYASCHEFLGESTLKFDEPGPESSAAAAGKASTPRPLTLPAGLQFKLLFTQPIDTDTAAAGDRIKAKLNSVIRDGSSKVVLVPEGSEVTARIMRLEHFQGPPSSVRMLVKLEAVNVGGRSIPFAATMNWVVQPFVKDGRLQQRIRLGSFDTLADPNIGVFDFLDVKANFVVKSGFESTWMTAAPQ
ncbi:MAG TPA: hypothetical protein VN841_18400 [Bryobacteraceae bacterium]|nr:hypothetical protein [Bryobacteraceae bacterium]